MQGIQKKRKHNIEYSANQQQEIQEIDDLEEQNPSGSDESFDLLKEFEKKKKEKKSKMQHLYGHVNSYLSDCIKQLHKIQFQYASKFQFEDKKVPGKMVKGISIQAQKGRFTDFSLKAIFNEKTQQWYPAGLAKGMFSAQDPDYQNYIVEVDGLLVDIAEDEEDEEVKWIKLENVKVEILQEMIRKNIPQPLLDSVRELKKENYTFGYSFTSKDWSGIEIVFSKIATGFRVKKKSYHPIGMFKDVTNSAYRNLYMILTLYDEGNLK